MGLIFRLKFAQFIPAKETKFIIRYRNLIWNDDLVVANSFSHGLVDVLINDIVSKSFGHLVIQGLQGNSGIYDDQG